MLPMIIEVYRSYSLLFAAKDGEDVNRLKLEKTGQNSCDVTTVFTYSHLNTPIDQ